MDILTILSHKIARNAIFNVKIVQVKVITALLVFFQEQDLIQFPHVIVSKDIFLIKLFYNVPKFNVTFNVQIVSTILAIARNAKVIGELEAELKAFLIALAQQGTLMILFLKIARNAIRFVNLASINRIIAHLVFTMELGLNQLRCAVVKKDITLILQAKFVCSVRVNANHVSLIQAIALFVEEIGDLVLDLKELHNARVQVDSSMIYNL